MIEKGSVQLVVGEGGQPQVAADLTDGDFLGEVSVLTGEAHTTSALAVSDAELWGLNRDAFEALMLKYPVLGVNLSRALSRRLLQARQRPVYAERVAAPAPSRQETAPIPVAIPAARAVAPATARPVAPAATPPRLPPRTAPPASSRANADAASRVD